MISVYVEDENKEEACVFFFFSFFLLYSLFFSLSFSPHGGDTTVPSALHLFNKDLLCSKTLIHSAHTLTHTLTHTHTHTSRLLLVTGRKRKKKKVRDWKRLALSLSTLTLMRGERAGWHTEVGMPIMASSASVWHTATCRFGTTILVLSYTCL